MNRFMQEQWPIFDGTNKMRMQLLDSLNEADLAFNPGGLNITLGALCREMGEVEYSYIQSLKTFQQDWAYRNPEPGLDGSLDKLKAWFEEMDKELKAIVSAMSDEDLSKNIERGFSVPVEYQLQIYLQALLIFFGKVAVYVKAMNRSLPQQFQEWIG